jgi:hypothetical protein
VPAFTAEDYCRLKTVVKPENNDIQFQSAFNRHAINTSAKSMARSMHVSERIIVPLFGILGVDLCGFV